MRRWLIHMLTLATLLTGGASLWALAQNPFAQAYVARSPERAAAALERQIARHATSDRLTQEVSVALETGDLDRLGILMGLVAERGIALPAPVLAQAEAQIQASRTTTRRIAVCATCAWDIAQCPTMAHITACALPVELTPLGDVNALRRAASAYGAGDPVDRLDMGLALVGLAATGAILVTAGGSASVKTGATALRLARRMNRLTPGFAAELARNGDVIRDKGALPAYLAGRAPLGAVADTAKLSRLGAMSGNLGQVVRATSGGEAMALLRYVDSIEDTARLSRLARLQGPQTRATLHLLGKSHAFRALVRLSDLALTALALLGALAAQLFTLGLWAVRRLLRL